MNVPSFRQEDDEPTDSPLAGPMYPSIGRGAYGTPEWNQRHRQIAGKALTYLATEPGDENGWRGNWALWVLGQPARLFEKYAVGSVAKQGKLMGAWDLALNDPAQRTFRYHNAWLFREGAALAHASATTFKDGKWAKSPMGLPLPDPIEVHRRLPESRIWAQSHPDAVDSLWRMGLDPINFASAGIGAAKKWVVLDDIKALSSKVSELQGLGKSPAQVLAFAEIPGAAIDAHTLSIMREAKPEVAAHMLYSLGFRPTESALGPIHQGLSDARALKPKFFRAPGDLYSPELRTYANRNLELKAARNENFTNAKAAIMNELGVKSAADLKPVDMGAISEVLLKVGRPEHLKTEEVAAWVEHQAAALVSTGELTHITPDQVRQAGVFAKYSKMGHKPGTRYDPTYLVQPSLEEAEGAGSVTAAGWRKARDTERVAIEDSQKALDSLANVVAREKGKMDVEGFQKMLDQAASEIAGESPRIREINGRLALAQAKGAHIADKETVDLMAELKDLKSKSATALPQTEQQKQLLEGISGLRKYADEFKVADFGVKEAGGLPLKLVDGMNAVIRKGQLVYNPSWYVQNFVDSTFVRNAVATGSLDFLTEAPLKFRMNGQPLEFGSKLTKDLLDLPEASSAMKLGDAVENFARTRGGSYAYKTEFNRLIGMGADFNHAEESAYRFAQNFVSDTHIDYDKLSGADQVWRRLSLYPKFQIENTKFWMKAAANHPTEAYAVHKMDQFFKDNAAIDRFGAVSVGETQIDMTKWMSWRRVHDQWLDPKGIIFQDGDKLGPILRGAKLIGGAPLPYFEYGMKRGEHTVEGLAQAMARSQPVLNILRSAARTIDKPQDPLNLDLRAWHEKGLAENFSGAFDDNLLFQRKENDPYRAWQIRRKIAGQVALGQKPDAEAAAQAVDDFNFNAGMIGFGAGLWPKPMDKGDQLVNEKVKRFVRDYEGAIKAAVDSGDTKGARNLYQSRELFYQANPEIHPIVPRTPGTGERERRLQHELDATDPRGLEKTLQKIETMPEPSRQGFLMRLPSQLYAKVTAALPEIRLRNPFVETANAAEFGPDFPRAPEPPMPPADGKRPSDAAMEAESAKLTKLDTEAKARQDARLATEVTKPKMLDARDRATANVEYKIVPGTSFMVTPAKLAEIRDVSKYTPLQIREVVESEQVLQRAQAVMKLPSITQQRAALEADPHLKVYVDAKIADNKGDAYLYRKLKNVQIDPYRSEDIPETAKSNAADLQKSVIRSAGQMTTADQIVELKALVDNARTSPAAAEALKSRLLQLDPGLGRDADLTDLGNPEFADRFSRNLDQSLQIMIGKQKAPYGAKVTSPEEEMTKRLEEFSRHDQDRMSETIDYANQLIDQGRLKSDYWQQLKSANPKLYQDAGMHDLHGELRAVGNSIAIPDQSGRFVGLDVPQVQEYMRQGRTDLLQYISAGYGVGYDSPVASSLRNFLGPVKTDDLVSHSTENMDLRARFFQPDFVKALGAPPAAPSLPTLALPQAASPIEQDFGARPKPTTGDNVLAAASGINAVRGLLPSRSSAPARIQSAQANFLIPGDPGRTLPTRQFPTIGHYIGQTFKDHAATNAWRAEQGLPMISIASTAYKNLFTYGPARAMPRAVAGSAQDMINQDFGPGAPQKVGLSVNPAQIGSAVYGVYTVANLTRLNDPSKDTDFNAGMQGLGAGLSVFSAMSAFGVPPVVSAPIAIGFGIYQGIFGRRKPDRAAEERRRQYEAEAAARAEALRLYNEKIQATRDAQSLTARERTLSAAFADPTRRPAGAFAANQLAAFKARPSYGSRLGLIDQVEREVNLKPRL